MKLRLFSLLLVTLVSAACGAGIGQETVVLTAGDAAVTLPTAAIEAQDSAAVPSQTATGSEEEAPAPTAMLETAVLPVIGPAPPWSNNVWINSDPLPLEDLRGKVVLLEFWTFG